MGRAEVGTPKYVANKMKSRGLQRLRWYCQVCEKQCRDENGFKCHTMSESHVRNMMLVGENPKKHLAEFSLQFKQDFISLLKSGHGEKSINVNRFYQEYIQNKEHVHMNSTKWVSLTEFAKYLGREGICRVTESEKDGLCIAWIDNSAEALKRKEASRKRDRVDRDEEHISQRLLQQQIQTSQKAKSAIVSELSDKPTVGSELKRDSGPIKLNLSSDQGIKSAIKLTDEPKPKKQLNVFSRPKTSTKVEKSTANKPLSALERIVKSEQRLRL